jgi:hypothetical protein
MHEFPEFVKTVKRLKKEVDTLKEEVTRLTADGSLRSG